MSNGIDVDVPPIEETDNETLLERIRYRAFVSYTGESGSLYGDSTTEIETKGDYQGRFVYELLQNADDAVNGRERRAVLFELDGSMLYVANTGSPLDADDVHALCVPGLSSKSDEEASIGRKGRGFTSVLEVTDRPAIYSTKYQFKFDSERARSDLVDHTPIDDLSATNVPTLRLPFVPDETPDRVKELLSDETDYTTVFAFRLRDDIQEEVQARLDEIDAKTLVFLQNIEELKVERQNRSAEWDIDRDDLDIVESARKISIREDGHSTDFVHFRWSEIPIEQRGGLDGAGWQNVETTTVGVAFGLKETDGDGLSLAPISGTTSIHVFLPTECASPGDFLINGAFKPESSRTRIKLKSKSEGYNAFLIDQIAQLVATDVVQFAHESETSASAFLACLQVEGHEKTSEAESYCAERLRTNLRSVRFVPSVDEPDTFLESSDRLAPIEILVPTFDDAPDSIASDLVSAYGPNELPTKIDTSATYFPSSVILDGRSSQGLVSLGAKRLDPIDIPTVLAEADDGRISVRSFDEVSNRAEVDPVVEILLVIDDILSGDQRDTFQDRVHSEKVFPIRVDDSGQIIRSTPGDDTLLLPPEDVSIDVEFTGVQLLAPEIYRPPGWSKPAGANAESDGFREVLMNLWGLDRFNFQSFVGQIVLPRLPRGREEVGAEEELHDLQRLQFIKERSVSGAQSVADTSDPLPHRFRKKSEYYRLCMLPVPTKEQGWQRAYRVYFGPEWIDGQHEHASAVSILRECGIDSDRAPELAPPAAFVDDIDDHVTNFAEIDDEAARDRVQSWRRFFTWLGVTSHVRLTPLWHPEYDREYSSTSGLGRPSSAHPTLGALDDETWAEFQSHIEKAVEESPAGDRSTHSIYQVHRLQFWPEISSTLDEFKRTNRREDAYELGRQLFLHVAYWWEQRYRESTTVGVGAHSTSASNVGARSDGIPDPTEQFHLGTDLWLWELKRAAWCPSDHGLHPPTRVWRRTPSLVRRFQLTPRGDEVLLPLLPETLTAATEAVPSDFFSELEIADVVTEETFEPMDALGAVRRIARWCETVSDEERGAAVRELRTAYRNLARALPDGTTLPEEWTDARPELQTVDILCETEEGFELVEATDAYYVTNMAEDEQIPLDRAPVFVLKEPDASGFGTVFGLSALPDAVTRKVDHGALLEQTTQVKEYLTDAVPYLRCVLARDRPEQIDEDQRALQRFIDEFQLRESLTVTYTLGGERTVNERDWVLLDPDQKGGRRTPIVAKPGPEVPRGEKPQQLYQRIARALSDYIPYPGVSDLLIVLQEPDEEKRRRKLKLINAPLDFLELDSASTSRVRFGDIDDPTPTTEVTARPTADAFGQTESERTVKRNTSASDPAADLIDPDEVGFEFEQQFRPDSRTTTKSLSNGGTTGSDQTGQSSELSSNPSAGAARDAPDRVGSAILERYEYDRLHREFDAEVEYSECVHSVERPAAVDHLESHDAAVAVYEWLVSEFDLDRSYPGFDFFVVSPEFVATYKRGDCPEISLDAVERLIELKSLRGDGETSLSLNEWMTATTDGLGDQYYLYVVGNLRQSTPDEFVREIRNPAQALESYWEETTQTNVSLQIDTRQFNNRDYVTQTPLDRKQG